jgi:hypothetical protein
VDGALALSGRSQSPQVRLAVAAVVARVEAAEGLADEALVRLEAALAEAVKLGFVGLQLELRLARGEIAIGSGRTAAAGDLRTFAGEARARGFALLARKAEAALAAPPGRPRGAS